MLQRGAVWNIALQITPSGDFRSPSVNKDISTHTHKHKWTNEAGSESLNIHSMCRVNTLHNKTLSALSWQGRVHWNTNECMPLYLWLRRKQNKYLQVLFHQSFFFHICLPFSCFTLALLPFYYFSTSTWRKKGNRLTSRERKLFYGSCNFDYPGVYHHYMTV